MILRVRKQWWSWSGSMRRKWRLGSSRTLLIMWPNVVTGSSFNSIASRQSSRARLPQAGRQKPIFRCPPRGPRSNNRCFRRQTSSSRSPTAILASLQTIVGSSRRKPLRYLVRKRLICCAQADSIMANFIRVHRRHRQHFSSPSRACLLTSRQHASRCRTPSAHSCNIAVAALTGPHNRVGKVVCRRRRRWGRVLVSRTHLTLCAAYVTINHSTQCSSLVVTSLYVHLVLKDVRTVRFAAAPSGVPSALITLIERNVWCFSSQRFS